MTDRRSIVAPCDLARLSRPARRSALCGIILAALIVLPCCGSRPPTPDLTALVSGLTSTDPGAQEALLAPTVQRGDDETPGVLPPSASIVLLPQTWQEVARDESGAPVEGLVSAFVTLPGGAADQVLLHVVRIGDRWLLAETSPS